jgi:hypothetical protein
MPTLPAAQSPLLNTLQVINRAWRLFSKREWWRDTVSGGIKGVEFTMGNPHGETWDAQIHGYHVHVHLLVLSSWVEWRRMRVEWSESLRRAWSEFGIEHGINTKDGMAVCDVRLVVNRKNKHRGAMISGDGAINEVAKYLTKSESWDQIPESQLVEVASLDRWPRMFELLGECRGPSKPRAPAFERVTDDDDRPLGEERNDLEKRLHALLWQDGSIEAIGLWIRARGEIAESPDFVMQKETANLVKHTTAYLDTPHLSGGQNCRDGPIWTRRRRGESIRAVGAKLIAAGNRKLWQEMLAALVSERRSFRRAFQVRTYPFATFRDLVGHTWYGLTANPAHA